MDKWSSEISLQNGNSHDLLDDLADDENEFSIILDMASCCSTAGQHG